MKYEDLKKSFPLVMLKNISIKKKDALMKKLYLLSTVTCLSLLGGCSQNTENQSITCNVPQQQKEPKMITTPSGLRYEILTQAPDNAQEAKKGDFVTVHYTGWLDENGTPGTKFDSSVDRNQPFQFHLGLGQVIKGWDEGVQGMKVGEKRRLIIPAAIGYGSRGAGAVIPPHATLIFDVELLKV